MILYSEQTCSLCTLHELVHTSNIQLHAYKTYSVSTNYINLRTLKYSSSASSCKMSVRVKDFFAMPVDKQEGPSSTEFGMDISSSICSFELTTILCLTLAIFV